MTDRERELLSDMDDKTVEEISQFSGGLDDAAKARILEKCKRKMKTDNKNEAVNKTIDDKDGKDNKEISIQIKHPVQNKRKQFFLCAAACIAFIAVSSVVISSLMKKDNIPVVPPVPTSQETSVSSEDTSVTSQALNAVTSCISKNSGIITDAPVTSVQTTAEVTTVETTSSEISDTQIDYEDEYMKVFAGMTEDASQRYFYLFGYGVECDCPDGMMVYYDYETREVYFEGTYAEYEKNLDILHKTDHACVAYKLIDKRFSNPEEYKSYIGLSFAPEITDSCCDSLFILYNGTYYFLFPWGKGEIFESWQTNDAVISDIIPDKSFVITAYYLVSEPGYEMLNSAKHRLTFTNTDDGWRISKIEDASSGVVYFP